MERPTEEETLRDDAGNEVCVDMGGARRQREEPASVIWVVGCPGRCSPEQPVQQTGPQKESGSAHHLREKQVGRGTQVRKCGQGEKRAFLAMVRGKKGQCWHYGL